MARLQDGQRLSPALALLAALLLACSACSGQANEPADLSTPGSTAGEERQGPDGGMYVWVPPGGFLMGAETGDPDEKPLHRVRITAGFWLSKCEITNAQYRRFCEATGREFPAHSDQTEDHPVHSVTWHDAAAYCAHHGLRLPTEAEWEYAARGPESRTYPWGNEWAVDRCCWGGNLGPERRTFPVGSLPEGRSWCGAMDMVGNVREWCADWMSESYYGASPEADPEGPGSGEQRACRGGGWSSLTAYCRCADRDGMRPGTASRKLGFRTAGTSPTEAPTAPGG